MKNERSTGLSLPEIIRLLNGDNDQYPKCMLANEVGTICRLGEDRNGEGEATLVALLKDKEIGVRAVAFCCLSCIDGAKVKHADILAKFRANPDNVPFLERIDEMLAEA